MLASTVLATRSYRIGVDIGGTFTDVVFVSSDGTVVARKVPSTPADYSMGILNGLKLLLEAGVAPEQVEELVHGTTVATNAILEKRGAHTALLTTAGFRDVLEIRRVRMPQLYNIQWDKPSPLVPRYLRYELTERVDHRGEVITPLNEDEVRAAAAALRAEGVESVAVCLINSYVNPNHEVRVGVLLRELLPGVRISLSADIIKEIKEFERTSTTVINAYIKPVVEQYLQSLEQRLADAGFTNRLLIMQSNGAVMTAHAAQEQPCYIVESGPAAGVIASLAVAEETGTPNVITFDMGGTTAKAAMIEAGQISLTDEYEVGAGITVGGRLMKGEGYLLRIPAIDLAEVGAGGGSLARMDAGGYLQVGPRSAGSVPGPACYGAGNSEPTITDANVVLGYINPDNFAGGSLQLRRELAWEALERLGRQVGMDALEAAYAVHTIGNARMSRAIQAVSTERGRDVRDYLLCAFGGSGPIHAVHLAASLGIRRVLIPRLPGVFSALGMIFSQVGHQFIQTFRGRLDKLDGSALRTAVLTLQDSATRQLGQLGYALENLRFRCTADLRYVGQSFSLTVELPESGATGADLQDQLQRRFEAEHQRTYGHSADGAPIEVVNLRLSAAVGKGRESGPGALQHEAAGALQPAGWRSRKAYFSREQGLVDTRVVGRQELHEPMVGPLVVEEYDTTIVVPPACRAQLDQLGNVVVDVEG